MDPGDWADRPLHSSRVLLPRGHQSSILRRGSTKFACLFISEIDGSLPNNDCVESSSSIEPRIVAIVELKVQIAICMQR